MNLTRNEWRIAGYGLLLAFLLAAWRVMTPVNTPDIAWAERNQAIVTREARAQRLRADSASTASVRAEKRLANTAMLLNTAMLRASSVSDSSRVVVADTSSDVPTLRHALSAQLVVTDSLIASIFVYRASVDAYRDTVAVERVETQRALAMWADSVPKATQQAVDAYKREIRALRVKQAAWIGGTGLLLWVVLK